MVGGHRAQDPESARPVTSVRKYIQPVKCQPPKSTSGSHRRYPTRSSTSCKKLMPCYLVSKSWVSRTRKYLSPIPSFMEKDVLRLFHFPCMSYSYPTCLLPWGRRSRGSWLDSDIPFHGFLSLTHSKIVPCTFQRPPKLADFGLILLCPFLLT